MKKENENKLNEWFSFMDRQMDKLKKSNEIFRLNNILIDNDIEPIE